MPIKGERLSALKGIGFRPEEAERIAKTAHPNVQRVIIDNAEAFRRDNSWLRVEYRVPGRSSQPKPERTVAVITGDKVVNEETGEPLPWVGEGRKAKDQIEYIAPIGQTDSGQMKYHVKLTNRPPISTYEKQTIDLGDIDFSRFNLSNLEDAKSALVAAAVHKKSVSLVSQFASTVTNLLRNQQKGGAGTEQMRLIEAYGHVARNPRSFIEAVVEPFLLKKIPPLVKSTELDTVERGLVSAARYGKPGAVKHWARKLTQLLRRPDFSRAHTFLDWDRKALRGSRPQLIATYSRVARDPREFIKRVTQSLPGSGERGLVLFFEHKK